MDTTFTMAEVVQILGTAAVVAGSHWKLSTRVARIETRIDYFDEVFKKLENTLERIERKLDNKADK